ncbi:MAG: archease [Candidatus Bipolaricaulota bacterium]|nr:archease [Candidatus Bipolaricaulota bacterium]
MGFTYLDHTADIAVRAWGGTVGEAFAEAARGLIGAMVSLEYVRPMTSRAFALRGSSLELLLVDWLAALVAEKDVSGLVFARFDVDIVEDGPEVALRASAWGEPLDPARHEPRLEVKGISLLGLRVRVDGETWFAEYVADV